jgi:DNA-binding NarL/FixJ family response regulator
MGSTIPVVFVTAFDQEATRIETMSVNCVAYLRKRVVAAELAAAEQRRIRCGRSP